MASLEAEFFGAPLTPVASGYQFRIDCESQGVSGVERVRQALHAGDPYAVAFVDARMPPGIDGIETVSRIWAIDPDVQVVVCTAYSDHSWDHIVEELGHSEGLLILKKPFDTIEITQVAHALAHKWSLQNVVSTRLQSLESQIERQRKAQAEMLLSLESIRADAGRLREIYRSSAEMAAVEVQEDQIVATQVPAAIQSISNRAGRMHEMLARLQQSGSDMLDAAMMDTHAPVRG